MARSREHSAPSRGILMPERREQQSESPALHIPGWMAKATPIWLLVVGTLFGMMINAFTGGVWVGKNVPDKDAVNRQIEEAVLPIAKQLGEVVSQQSEMKKYVDAKAQENHDYTNQTVANAVKQLTDHSDFNRESMRGDTKQLQERIDALKDQVRDMSGQLTDLLKRTPENPRRR